MHRFWKSLVMVQVSKPETANWKRKSDLNEQKISIYIIYRIFSIS